MSQKNVELVREILEAFDRRDYVGLGDFFEPDLEFARIGAEFADLAGEWRGLAAAWEAIVQFFREWEDTRTEPERFFDLGDRVLVFVKQIGRGRASGAVAEHEGAFLFIIREGKVIRFEGYWDRGQAQRAAGLEEARPNSP